MHTNDTGIVELDLHHISSKNIKSSVLTALKNSNYKVMKCYNLVFNFKIFCHNYGSIITLVFFLIYITFMIYSIIKGIFPFRLIISKLLFEEKSEVNNNSFFLYPEILQTKNKIKSENTKKSRNKKKKKKSKKMKESFPPKKEGNIARKSKHNYLEEKNDLKIIDLSKKDKEDNINSDKIIFNQDEKILTINEAKENKNKKNNIHFDDYEFNNMDYNDAIEYDKRGFLRTYWSVIKREHYFIFAFFSRNDYNLFYVKIERFLILICTEITMNGLFFVHETMYKKQTRDTSFVQKIPQIIFSLLVSQAVEVILCFLSMTDKYYYEIKALPKKEKNDQRVFDILSCMKKKLIGFFVFTFLFFLFHWYFISAFCAVYQNTQFIYLRDSAISILTSFATPFILYGFTCLLREISLSKCCKNKLSFVYKLSDIVPLF